MCHYKCTSLWNWSEIRWKLHRHWFMCSLRSSTPSGEPLKCQNSPKQLWRNESLSTEITRLRHRQFNTLSELLIRDKTYAKILKLALKFSWSSYWGTTTWLFKQPWLLFSIPIGDQRDPQHIVSVARAVLQGSGMVLEWRGVAERVDPSRAGGSWPANGCQGECLTLFNRDVNLHKDSLTAPDE